MPGRLPFDRPPFGGFRRSYVGHARGPFGCLAALLLCPIGLVVGLVMLVASLFTMRRMRRAAAARAAAPASGSRDEALRRLVRAMALDETFTADEARQAGTLSAGGATVDDLIADATARGWIEVRGERLAVTRRGREGTDERRLGS